MPNDHLIAKYKVYERRVLCDCGWEDDENEFQTHRKAMGATRRQRAFLDLEIEDEEDVRDPLG